MGSQILLAGLILIEAAAAYPWVANSAGVDASLLGNSRPLSRRDSPDCPINPNHVPAPLVTPQFPYNNAKNGQKGDEKGGYVVPHPDDYVHRFIAPDPKKDIRGPCPGINAMANHGFLARDGITTYNELVDAQQNVYNVGYDLANLLATAGVVLDGDMIGTQKLSIGCDATSRTATQGNVLADELGLNGHNHFEADASLTRNDYFTANGDNYRLNVTLFEQMMEYCNGNCGLQELSRFREFRFNSSKKDNPNFFFSPGSLLLYGAATFLYELFPTANGPADEATMMSFFGVSKDNSGAYYKNDGERIPANWTVRADPYTDFKVGREIFAMYLLHPVPFGGNVGKDNYLGMNFLNYIQSGQLKPNTTPSEIMCLIYQATTLGFPSQFGKIASLPADLYKATVGRLTPGAAALGCPLNFNSGDGVSGSS